MKTIDYRRKKMKRNIFSTILTAILLVTAIMPLGAVTAGKSAAWSSDVLSEPLSPDGSILRDNNVFSFTVNPPGIPAEPMFITASLSPSIDPDTGTLIETGQKLFDPDFLAFDDSQFLVRLGGTVTQLTPGSVTYFSNGNELSSEGENVDLIKGSSARLSLKYNPEFTHQQGALWYTPGGVGILNFSAGGGQSEASVFATDPTFDPSAEKGNSVISAATLRAVSIYDPWFTRMEMAYDSKYGEEDWRVDDWKVRYLAMSDAQHNYTDEAIEAWAKEAGMTPEDYWASLTEEEKSMWAYPAPDDVSIYCDFQVTVREPIETVEFTSHAQSKASQGAGNLGTYVNLNDPIRHPDQTSVNEIFCYDTSDAGSGEYTVDGFLITTEIMPDYGYELTFRLVEGSSIGSVDMSGLDAADNNFRFVPHGSRETAEGFTVTNYGDVVIEVTAAEVNYKEYFTLHYLPSNLRMVAWIGEDKTAGVNESTVPDGWDKGVKTYRDNVDGIPRTIVDVENSGRWDVYNPAISGGNENIKETELYGLQCVVLYPGETFDLAAVSYIRPDGNPANPKEPFYMTTGVPAIDYSQPDEEQYTWTRYAVTFGTYANSDAEEIVDEIVGFEKDGNPHYGEIRETAGGMEELYRVEGDTPTGRSWWYEDDGAARGDALTIVGLNQGICYLSYTLSPIDPDTGEITYGSGTLTGGFYVFVVDPVDQVLGNVVQKATNATMGLLIPYDISISQIVSADSTGKARDAVYDKDGNRLPSHWYMGIYGAVEDMVPNSGSQNATGTETDPLPLSMVNGRSYASFSLRNGQGTMGFLGNDRIMLDVFGDRTRSADDIKNLGFNNFDRNKPFTISSEVIEDSAHPEALINDPLLMDIEVTGDYGVNSFDNLRFLRIIDSAGMLTRANMDSRGIFDLGSLKNVVYYQHEGIGQATGPTVKEIILPMQLQYLDLSPKNQEDSDPKRMANWLRSTKLTYGPGRLPYSDNLLELDVGYNDFDFLTVSSYRVLYLIDAGGTPSSSAQPGLRKLYVNNCPELKLVDANETRFNYIIVDWQESDDPEDFIKYDGFGAIDVEKRQIRNALRANSSIDLIGVAVSGSLDYLELEDDQALKSVIGTTQTNANFSNLEDFNKMYKTDADGVLDGPDWIKLVNLGGDSYVNPSSSGNMYFSSELYLGFISTFEDSISTMLFGNASDLRGSYAIETLQFNKLQRLVYDDERTYTNDGEDGFGSFYTGTKQLKTLRINAIIGGIRLHHLTNADSDGTSTIANERDRIYDLSLNYAKQLQTIEINYVDPNTTIDLSWAGRNYGDFMKVEVSSLESLLNMRYSGRVDGAEVNASKAPDGWRAAIFDISGSLITDIHGTSEFSDISVSPDSIVIEEEESMDINVYAVPSTFQSQMTVENVRVKSGNAAAITIKGASFTGSDSIINIMGNIGENTVVLEITGRVGTRSITKEVTVVVNKKPPETETRISLVVTPEDIVLDQKGSSAELSLSVISQQYEVESGLPVGDPVDMTDEMNAAASAGSGNGFVWNFSDPDLVTIEYLNEIRSKVRVTAKVNDDELTYQVSLTGGMFATSDVGHVTIKGENRFTITLSLDEIALHAGGSSAVSVTASLYDNDLQRPVQTPKNSFTWKVENSSVAKIESTSQKNSTVNVIPVNRGQTTIDISYQNRADGPVYEASLPVRYHEVGKITLDRRTGALDSGSSGFFTQKYGLINATVYCECGLSIPATENVVLRFTYSRNCGNTSHIFTGKNNTYTQYQITAPSGCSGGSFTITEILYQGHSFDPSSGNRKSIKSIAMQHSPEGEPMTLKGEIETLSHDEKGTDAVINFNAMDRLRTQASVVETRSLVKKSMATLLSLNDESTPTKVLEARVGTLKMNNCDNLRAIMLDNPDTVTKFVPNMYANNCARLDTIYITVSQIEFLEATNSSISTGTIASSISTINHLNLSDNDIGDGYLDIGSFRIKSWTGWSGVNSDGSNDWSSNTQPRDFANKGAWGLRNLEYLNLYNNRIYYTLHSEDQSNGDWRISAYIGYMPVGARIVTTISCPNGHSFFNWWPVNHRPHRMATVYVNTGSGGWGREILNTGFYYGSSPGGGIPAVTDSTPLANRLYSFLLDQWTCSCRENTTTYTIAPYGMP